MIKFTYLLLIALTLAGCLKVKDKPQEETQQAEGFDFQIRELPEANHYQVLIALPEDTQIVQRQIAGDPQSLISVPMTIQNGVLTDSHVEAGKSYIYEAGINRDGNFEVLKKRPVQIPLDREIGADEFLQKDENWTGYRRIIFREGSKLTTNGFQLFIQADQWIAPDGINSVPGLIQTIPAGSQAAPGQNGKSGGTIQVTVRTGRGNTKIEMRGQNGGAGLEGESVISPIIFPGNFGNGGPIDGKANFSNVDKADGHSGGNGGDTGRYEITIRESNSLNFIRNFDPGHGGDGGKGGRKPPAGTMPETFGVAGSKGQDGARYESCIYDSKNRICF